MQALLERLWDSGPTRGSGSFSTFREGLPPPKNPRRWSIAPILANGISEICTLELKANNIGIARIAPENN